MLFFYGRFELKNVGKVPIQPEFMEEDFLYAVDTDNELEFDVNASQSEDVTYITQYNMHDNDTMARLARMQSLQEQQKKEVFESTEATITRNRRSQVKRIRNRNFTVGDSVIFRNPDHSGMLQL